MSEVGPAPDDDTPIGAPLLDVQALASALPEGGLAAGLREALRGARREIQLHYQAGLAVGELLHQTSDLTDQVLTGLWGHVLGPHAASAALVAVGGYGRRELFPSSDIDVMVVIEPECQERCARDVERYLTLLWDVGLEVGHSVRTVEDCAREARADLTVVTNLMESRHLAGSPGLFEGMREATGRERIWPSAEFFAAKLAEQQARHARLDDAVYNLEPNVKEGLGGLRDVQLIGWVLKRHFGADDLGDLVRTGFLHRNEYATLIEARDFLWRVRFGLHDLTGRREDRLLFDHQRALAQSFGYRDDGHQLGVERFMKDYYRAIGEIDRLAELLLQLFREAILTADEPGGTTPINSRFRARDGYVEATAARVFERYPFALLEVFLILQQNPGLRGVRASTIRLIRDHRHLINDAFRADIRNRSLFLEVLRQPRGVTHALRAMHRYGVLAGYIPAFGAIVGQMQYDLFHVYTVDEHTLAVVRNLRRLASGGGAEETPRAVEAMNALPKPELAYLAALFHDIAKGRGGDHSELGAADALQFCLRHDLSAHDARLVAWLVRHHLTMSSTARREDITDPVVVDRFARIVGNEVHLNYLYVLTVADIRGTSPRVWNGWKAALLLELYEATLRALRRGLENPVDKAELVAEARDEAWGRLTELRRTDVRVARFWDGLPEDYFLRHSPEEIARHARAVIYNSPEDFPLVEVSPRSRRGGTEVFVLTRDRDYLFATATTVLDRLGLDVQDARIVTSRDGTVLDTFIVLDENGGPLTDPERLREVSDTLRRELAAISGPPAPVSRRAHRRLRHFAVSTEVRYRDDVAGRTVVEVTATDRPGVLARIAVALSEGGVSLHSARIATFGERVEDLFYVTDRSGEPLAAPACARLREHVLRALAD